MSHENKVQTNGRSATPEFLTAEEVSARLRLPLSTVYHLAKSGVLPAIQLGRSWRFPCHEMDELAGRKSAKAHPVVLDESSELLECAAKILKTRTHEKEQANQEQIARQDCGKEAINAPFKF